MRLFFECDLDEEAGKLLPADFLFGLVTSEYDKPVPGIDAVMRVLPVELTVYPSPLGPNRTLLLLEFRLSLMPGKILKDF